MLKWLDDIPLPMLAIAALLLGLAPFVPEPHLWQKIKMLYAGTLSRPLDIFDLFLHGTPLILLAIKLLRMRHPER
jgi:hypothetical protein